MRTTKTAIRRQARLTLAFCVWLSVVSVAVVCAQPAHRLGALTPLAGKTLLVVFSDGHQERALLVSATDDALTINVRGGQRTVDVRDVRLVLMRHRGTLGGAVGGAAIGLIVGALNGNSESCPGKRPCTGLTIAYGSVAGAAIGAFLGSRHVEEEILYERPHLQR